MWQSSVTGRKRATWPLQRQPLHHANIDHGNGSVSRASGAELAPEALGFGLQKPNLLLAAAGFEPATKGL